MEQVLSYPWGKSFAVVWVQIVPCKHPPATCKNGGKKSHLCGWEKESHPVDPFHWYQNIPSSWMGIFFPPRRWVVDRGKKSHPRGWEYLSPRGTGKWMGRKFTKSWMGIFVPMRCWSVLGGIQSHPYRQQHGQEWDIKVPYNYSGSRKRLGLKCHIQPSRKYMDGNFCRDI